MGAYLELVTPGIPLLGAWIYSGPYAGPNYSFEFTGVFTNTTPTDAYRGAGRPEATYAIERTMDALAKELGKDPVELRRMNFVKEFPHTMASGLTIDSGDYGATLDRPLERLDLASIRARPDGASRAGRREADRRRLLDLQRDVRPRSVAHPRSDPVRGRRLGRGDDPLPAAGLRPGGGRHVAARPGPRDDVRADRGRPARRRRGRHRGDPRRHGLVPARDGHVRQQVALGRRGRAVARRPRR